MCFIWGSQAAWQIEHKIQPAKRSLCQQGPCSSSEDPSSIHSSCHQPVSSPLSSKYHLFFISGTAISVGSVFTVNNDSFSLGFNAVCIALKLTQCGNCTGVRVWVVIYVCKAVTLTNIWPRLTSNPSANT